MPGGGKSLSLQPSFLGFSNDLTGLPYVLHLALSRDHNSITSLLAAVDGAATTRKLSETNDIRIALANLEK